MIRSLTAAELGEAKRLADAAAIASHGLDRALAQISQAVAASVDQTSSRWNALCDSLDLAVQARRKADLEEVAWWAAKGFGG
jgi:hypothetical protein